MVVPTASSDARLLLRRYFETLLGHFGEQRWWPARTRLEVILGAILTQNTAWRNAALAIRELRKAGLLNLDRLRRTPQAALTKHIRSAGFYRQKARAIRDFLDWLNHRYGGSLRKLFALPPAAARQELLQIQGIGQETADAILLYAGHQPYFVADAYTRRILQRHGLIQSNSTYAETQHFLHQSLPSDHRLYNEFHALLVEAGKNYCWRNDPQCDACPLRPYLPPPASPRTNPTRRPRAGARSRIS